MPVRINKSDFTHYASFYGVPCYLKPEDDEGCVLAGRNFLFDSLLPVVTFFHNYFIAPFFAEVGFPIKNKGEIERGDGDV